MPRKTCDNKYVKLISGLLACSCVASLVWSPRIQSRTDIMPASEFGFIMIGSIVSAHSDNVILLKNKETGKVRAYRTGATLLRKYTIDEIAAELITLSFFENRQRKFLKIHKDGFTPTVTKKKAVVVKKAADYDGSFREEGFERTRNEIAMSDDYRQRLISKDLPQILLQAAAAPEIVDGQIIGFSLEQIEPGSIYEKSGLKNGDIITSINSIKLDDVTATIKLLHTLKSSKNIDFEILRQGTKHSVDVKVK